MNNDISIIEFETLIKENYLFLINDLDFKLYQYNDWSFEFENPHTIISISLERTVLGVALGPNGIIADDLFRREVSIEPIDVAIIAMCLDPNLKYTVIRIDGNKIAHNIPVEMKRRALVLKEYCIKYIAGDYSDWAIVVNIQNMRAQELHKILYL